MEQMPPIFIGHEAKAAGVGWRQLRRLQEAGTTSQLFRGVYLPADAVDDPIARARAVARILPPGAAVCRETAAWLHGIDVRTPGLHLQPPALQCIVPVGTARRRRPGVLSYESSLSAADVTTIHGVPTTTHERTALDLARYAKPFMGLAALDAYARLDAIDPALLLRRTRELAGERFIARARRLIKLCDPRAESAGESWLRLRIVEAGLPVPELQIELKDSRGRVVYRLDAGYQLHKVGAEFDGEMFHFRTHAQLRHDELRREDMRLRFGWTAVAFDKGHVLGHEPIVEQTIGDLIGHAQPLVRRSSW